MTKGIKARNGRVQTVLCCWGIKCKAAGGKSEAMKQQEPEVDLKHGKELESHLLGQWCLRGAPCSPGEDRKLQVCGNALDGQHDALEWLCTV